MYENQENVVPLIWQGDTGNASPNYAQRKSFYGVGGIPHTQFGGIIDVVGGGGDMYNLFLAHYNSLIDEESPLELDVAINLVDDEKIVNASLEVIGEIETSNNKIVFIVTRDLGGSYFSSVSTFETQVFELSQIGETGNYEYTLPDNDWDINQMGLAVFVQTWDNDPEPNSHTILQASYSKLNALLNPVEPLELDFGEVEVGESETQEFTITNYWEEELTGSIFSVMDFDLPGEFAVAPNETEEIEITFTPSQAMEYNNEILIMTNHEDYGLITLYVSGEGQSTSTEEELEQITEISDLKCYPNPFYVNKDNKANISFNLKNTGYVELSVFDIKGCKLKTIFSGNLGAEENVLSWDGRDKNGEVVNSGIYFYKLKTNNNVITNKVLISK